MSTSEDGFTVVSSKRGKKNKKFRSTNIHSGARNLLKKEDNVDCDEILEKVLKLKFEVQNDQYADIVRDGLNFIKRHLQEGDTTTKTDLIAYGVGNFTSCLIARYQLALLLVVRDEFANALKNCEVYDPVFMEGEKEVLKKLDLSVMQENEEGKRKVRSPTIFYMPHCGKALYNNLLWANWSPNQLRNVVIIGNSFDQMLESTPSSLLKTEASYIFTIEKYKEELPLENKFRFDDIFNNTSIHIFKNDLLNSADDSFWENNEEPIYDENVEIIKRR